MKRRFNQIRKFYISTLFNGEKTAKRRCFFISAPTVGRTSNPLFCESVGFGTEFFRRFAEFSFK